MSTYWSVEDCAWRTRAVVDALATPWSPPPTGGRPRAVPDSDLQVLRVAGPVVAVPRQPSSPEQEGLIRLWGGIRTP